MCSECGSCVKFLGQISVAKVILDVLILVYKSSLNQIEWVKSEEKGVLLNANFFLDSFFWPKCAIISLVLPTLGKN